MQPHTFLQTVQKHGSHQRPFFRHTGFLFDNRSERQQFVNVLQRQTAVAGSPDFFQRFLHSGPRLQDNAVAAGSEFKTVGLRQQLSLLDVKVNLAFQIGIIGNQIHNLTAGQSFGNGYPAEKNFPARNLVHRGLQRNPRHKLVLAGFEMLGQPVDSGHNAKQPGLINHAGARQLFRHRFQRRPFRNHHIGNVKERTAFRNPPLNLHISQHRQNNQKNDNKLFHRCSLHG